MCHYFIGIVLRLFCRFGGRLLSLEPMGESQGCSRDGTWPGVWMCLRWTSGPIYTSEPRVIYNAPIVLSSTVQSLCNSWTVGSLFQTRRGCQAFPQSITHRDAGDPARGLAISQMKGHNQSDHVAVQGPDRQTALRDTLHIPWGLSVFVIIDGDQTGGLTHHHLTPLWLCGTQPMGSRRDGRANKVHEH